jgi:hypothetical protein
MIELLKTGCPLHDEIINGWLNDNYHLILEKGPQHIELVKFIIGLDKLGFFIIDTNNIKTRFLEMDYNTRSFMIRFLPEFGRLLK